MSLDSATLGLLVSAAGGVESVRERLVLPAQESGWQVAVTATPTAGTWLRGLGELERIEDATGYPVRIEPRLPWEDSGHPQVDEYVIAPATANTVAKLASGHADNQLLTSACEAIGGQVTPVVVFPRVNAAHARQPMWDEHLQHLRKAGVHLVYGDDVWPLFEPRAAPPGRELPWKTILETANHAYAGRLASS